LEKLEQPLPPIQDKYLPIHSGSIAQLNLLAAKKSKNTSAYAQALIYIDVGKHSHSPKYLKKWDRNQNRAARP
jgi:predicted ATPase